LLIVYDIYFKKSFFFKKKTKAPQLPAEGLGMVRLPPPLLASFRTFKGNMIIENIRLNQLVLQFHALPSLTKIF